MSEDVDWGKWKVGRDAEGGGRCYRVDPGRRRRLMRMRRTATAQMDGCTNIFATKETRQGFKEGVELVCQCVYLFGRDKNAPLIKPLGWNRCCGLLYCFCKNKLDCTVQKKKAKK